MLDLIREAGVNSELFRDVAEMNRIELQLSPVEEHKAIDRGKRYHAPIWRIYLEVRKSYQRCSEKIELRLSV